VAAFEKTLAVDPKHVKAHNNMALASIDLGELELAEAHYRESLAIEPQAAIHNDLGFVLERQGLSEEAVEQYRKALELDPESASAHYNLAAYLARSGEYAEAERHFRAALDVKPSAATYTGLGAVLYHQGKVDDAVASLKAAIETDADYPRAYDQLAAIRVQQDELEEAASNYRLFVSKQPSAAGHEKLAQVLMRLGRVDEARKEMEMAKALDGNSVESQ